MENEQKTCERCCTVFECKVGQIESCQCFGVELNAETKLMIEGQFNDCLCRVCLLALTEENT